MESRNLESYAPDLYLLRNFAATEIAEMSTSQQKIWNEETPDSEWFRDSDIHEITRAVLSGIAWRVITFNFDCLQLHHREVDDLSESMGEILSDSQIVFDLVAEMVHSERTKLEEQEKGKKETTKKSEELTH